MLRLLWTCGGGAKPLVGGTEANGVYCDATHIHTHLDAHRLAGLNRWVSNAKLLGYNDNPSSASFPGNEGSLFYGPGCEILSCASPIRIDAVYKRSSIDRLRASERARARSRWHVVRDDVVMHFAYGQGARAILEGRVIDFEVEHVTTPEDRALTNLRRNLRLLFNKERTHRPVRAWISAREWHAVTDAEGFFRFELHNIAALAPGWHRIHAESDDASDEIGLLLVPPENVYGVISDVDDTVMISEVTKKRRLLINTLLRNPLQRLVVPEIAELYRSLLARNPRPSCAPMFYLSATPRQLHLPLQSTLDYNGLPKGALITKRVTNDRSSEPLDQFRYKFAKIGEILEHVPHARFILIGDDAERDPEVFESIREHYPDRIETIWIRHVHPELSRPRIAHQGDLADLLRDFS